MAEDDRRAFLTAPGDGQILKNPVGGPLTFTARGEQTGGALTVFETTPAPGEGPPLHRHPREDEVLYVLQGRFRVKLEATMHEAPAGSFVFIPRGVPHTWQNAGDDPARLLVLFAPAAAGMEQFFERSAKLGDDARVADAFKKFASDAGWKYSGRLWPSLTLRPRLRCCVSRNATVRDLCLTLSSLSG
jgi:quercetin dioxygenase-like cupin family protein